VGRADGPYNRWVETDLNHREGAFPVVNSSVAPSKEHLDALLSTRGRNAPGSALSDPRLSAGYISFIYGFPDMDSLPNPTVLSATQSALEKHGDWALQYGKTTGVAELVDVLLAKLQRDQGIAAGPKNLMITAGGSQAVQLVLDLLVDPGDVVIAEAPTWMGFIDALNNVGGKLVTVPLDDEGTDVEALEETLQRLRSEGVTPKFIYIISNFQNPSGISTTQPRRERIAQLAAEYGVLVLEDDAYHDLRFSGDRIPSIYSLDRAGYTMYLGTLSKIMGAGMRIGWLVGPEPLINKLAQLKFDGGTNIFGSFVASEWIPSYLDEHIDTLKEIYGRRRDLMLEALDENMPAGTTWTTPEGGFFVWLTLPEGIDAGQMLPHARERGVEYLPGATCYTDGRGKNQIRLSYSFARDAQIGEGIRIMADVIRGEMRELGIN
jgi:2-aminoadipate transaminase